MSVLLGRLQKIMDDSQPILGRCLSLIPESFFPIHYFLKPNQQQMNKLFSTVFVFLATFSGALAPVLAQSCCDMDETINLCYLSAADYCATNDNFCYEYSLDGEFMVGALAEKLLSPANYGDNGVVNCNLVLKKLSNITSVQTINNNGCDIVFLPVVSLDPNTLTSDPQQTFIPENVISAVYDWSLECDNNLVVVSQAEAAYWGYTMENANQNPNTPLPGASLSIFDGPFGSLPFFEQGGSFQGVFTSTPASGVEILANDANGNPTVGLDLATNDIVVGDIGIFCSGGAGVVTSGAGVLNYNDILVCNIFALACELAENNVSSEQLVELCPNESFTLPDGSVVSAPGIYVDTLVSFNGCDSIITTEVVDRVVPPTNFNRNGCENDGYSITVNGNVYNEQNPTGQELLLTSGGCDSIVNIQLSFFPPTSAAIAPVLCPGEFISLANGQIADSPGSYVDTLVSFSGCDSVLFIELSYYHNDTTYFETQLCPGDSVSVGGAAYVAGDRYTVVAQNIFGCDSLLVTDLILFPAPLVSVDSFVEVTQSDVTPFGNKVPDWYGIAWSPTMGLSCTDCPNPIVLPDASSTLFTLSVLDSIGCVWDFPIGVEYVCNHYVPNVFSPNDDGINDEFKPFSSGCPALGFQFEVFDRWGAKVFHSDDPKLGWDGNYRGKPANQGVYVYVVQLSEYGTDKLLSGDVILLRN